MFRSPVRPEKEALLKTRMRELGILEKDLRESFVRGRGPGGQKINKTAGCVFLKHIPSGISVKVQESRSAAMNRFFARRRLVEKYEQVFLGVRTAGERRGEKLRKQKARRRRRSGQRIKRTSQTSH